MERKRRNERGVILMTSLLFAMTILAFSASVITSGVAASNQKRYLIAKQRALGAAESGVYHLLAGLNGTQRASLMAAGKLEATLEGNSSSTRTVRYAVTFGSGATDDIDNDLDGVKDESDEADIIEVSSTGYADNLARTVRVTLIARHRQPSMPGAVYIADPNARLHLQRQRVPDLGQGHRPGRRRDRRPGARHRRGGRHLRHLR